VIIRFDSLPSKSKASASDTAAPITYLTEPVLHLVVDSAAVRVGVPVTINIYDVDDSTAVDDTSAAALAPLFTPSRLITSLQYDPTVIADSLLLPLPQPFILAKAQAHARLRLGLQVSASKSVGFHIGSTEASIGPHLTMRTSPDTAVAAINMSPYSVTPPNNASIAGHLGDFMLIVKGTAAPPTSGTLAIGGLPGTRAYLLFNIPPVISDSSLVVAATLVLTQRPSGSPDAADSMSIQPYLVLAGPGVVDAARAAQITAPAGVLGLARLVTTPGTTGVREVQVGPAFAYWSLQNASLLPRAIVLQSVQEDFSAQQSFFYSSDADPAFRPKLRISYTPRTRIGVP
jgi:hypothetical protein